MEALPRAVDLHHIHAWTLTSGKPVVSAHVRVDELADAGLLERITRLLRDDYAAHFSTIQIEQRLWDHRMRIASNLHHGSLTGNLP